MPRYQFLVERVHALRAPRMSRTQDWLWVFGTLLIVLGYGSIAGVEFRFPQASMAPDGRCRLGALPSVAIPMLALDLVMNLILTFAFIHLLGPVVQANSISSSGYPASHLANFFNTCCKRSRKRRADIRLNNPHVAKRIEKLLWRTFGGTCLVVIPTLANMVQLTITDGREYGFVCLTICSFDGTFRHLLNRGFVLILQSHGQSRFSTGLWCHRVPKRDIPACQFQNPLMTDTEWTHVWKVAVVDIANRSQPGRPPCHAEQRSTTERRPTITRPTPTQILDISSDSDSDPALSQETAEFPITVVYSSGNHTPLGTKDFPLHSDR